jgi:hypothetical protein
LTEEELIQKIRQSQDNENFAETCLETDERVIARVTDGIYRQPASALRELISNAYDADASRVVVKTDAPRFERIVVEDNGSGMTPEILAHLILHIGGSAKRNQEGKSLGITSVADSTLSPGGRKLIGKIGIGLFSVSQLTHSFQIISKVVNDDYRTVATITLRQYSDERPSSNSGGNERFEAGKVNIWREKAIDLEAHGTTVVLNHIRPQARDTLRSREIWSLIEEAERANPNDERQDIRPPKYHLGRVDPESGNLLKKTSGKFASVPWKDGASPDEAFRALVDSVWNEISGGTDPNPQISRLFDYYLRMIWQLSLAIPLPYVDGHPFDLAFRSFGSSFLLSNQGKSSASAVDAGPTSSPRQIFDLTTQSNPDPEFEVFVDNLKLSRPLRFTDLPTTTHALKQPLLFIGKCTQEFEKSPVELSGGPLEFEAYLFWAPKIAPVEHQGSLIRIHGSSGTLFDPTFMRYQVSEQTRLRQITCEIFVKRGLDSALNIDRESFNNAHPHSVFITKWLHNSLRQVASAQKRLASSVRDRVNADIQEATVSGIQSIARVVWEEQTGDEGSEPPPIKFTLGATKSSSKEEGDAYLFAKDSVLGSEDNARTHASRLRQSICEEKLKAIIQVLASFELLDQLPKPKQERLARAIYDILTTEER